MNGTPAVCGAIQIAYSPQNAELRQRAMWCLRPGNHSDCEVRARRVLQLFTLSWTPPNHLKSLPFERNRNRISPNPETVTTITIKIYSGIRSLIRPYPERNASRVSARMTRTAADVG